jgi:hypothetical protein
MRLLVLYRQHSRIHRHLASSKLQYYKIEGRLQMYILEQYLQTISVLRQLNKMKYIKLEVEVEADDVTNTSEHADRIN